MTLRSDNDASQIADAVDLLRRAGWRVDPPFPPLPPVATCPQCGFACLAGSGPAEDRMCLNARCKRAPAGQGRGP